MTLPGAPAVDLRYALVVSFAPIVGLFCLCSRSLLRLYLVVFASTLGLF